MNIFTSAFSTVAQQSVFSHDSQRLLSPRGNRSFAQDLSSAAASPTELNFPLQHGGRRRRPLSESLYDDPRSPYHVVRSYESPGEPLTPTPQTGIDSPLHVGFVPPPHGPGSTASSWDDPLPFGGRAAGSTSDSQSYQSLSKVQLEMLQARQAPNRTVRAVIHNSNPGAMRRLQRAVAGEKGLAMRMRSMAAGPAGSGKVAVASPDGLRILGVTYGRAPAPGASTGTPPSQTPSGASWSGSASSSRSLGIGPGGAKVEEVVNLWRSVPSGGSGRSVTDIEWGVGAFENKIIAGCSNGNFLVFDVQRGVCEREVTGEHSRSILCLGLSKVPEQGHRLLTAGADGFARLWDLRQPGRASLRTFRHPSSITAVTFSPPEVVSTSSANSYVMGLETGSIFRYEWRNLSRAVGRVTAAHGAKAVTALHWKGSGQDREDDRSVGRGGWLASAGLDRTVKVWDMSAVELPNEPQHIVFPSHPVHRLAWRPGHETEIAVISIRAGMGTAGTGQLTEDAANEDSTEAESRVEVWDVRRSYIAKYVLGQAARYGNLGAVTDVLWADCTQGGALQACYSGGTFAQMDMRLHRRPLDDVPRQALSWGASGELAIGVDRWTSGEIPFDDIKLEHLAHLDKIGVQPKGLAQEPFVSRQAVQTYTSTVWQDEESFKFKALHFRIPEGDIDDPREICVWNAKIAKEAEDTDAMQAWLMAERYLAAQIDEQSYSDQGSIVDSSHEDSATPLATGRREQDSSDRENLSGVGRQDYHGTSAYVSNDKAALAGSYRQGNAAFHGASGDQPEIGLGRGNSASVGEPASLRAAGSMGNLPLSGSIAAFRLASKGCQASHRPSVMGNADGDPGARSNAMETKGEDQDGVQWLRIMRNILRNVLDSIVDQGETQLAATIIVVLGRFNPFKRGKQMERVIWAYIDRLDRSRLAQVAAAFRKWTDFEDLRAATLGETMFHTRCSRCSRAVEMWDTEGQPDGYWYCQLCKRISSICVVCGLAITGLQQTCSLCGHGMHMDCAQRYLSHYKAGPVGATGPPVPLPRESKLTKTPTWTSFASGFSLGSDRSNEISMASDGNCMEGVGPPCPAGCDCYCWR